MRRVARWKCPPASPGLMHMRARRAKLPTCGPIARSYLNFSLSLSFLASSCAAAPARSIYQMQLPVTGGYEPTTSLESPRSLLVARPVSRQQPQTGYPIGSLKWILQPIQMVRSASTSPINSSSHLHFSSLFCKHTLIGLIFD